MKDLHINHLRLLQILAKVSVVFVLPFWALMDLHTILGYSDLVNIVQLHFFEFMSIYNDY